MDISQHLQHRINRVDTALKQHLCGQEKDQLELHKAMSYAVFNGGKRIRPLFVYMTGEALGASLKSLDNLACAVEFIHAYSLIHDDLPAMDNADLRRGKPSCHKAFNEATAILAGDALLPLAFELLARDQNYNAELRIKMLSTLAHAAGSSGMVGGQALDLAPRDHSTSLDDLEQLYNRKTGALMRASVILGTLAANCLQENTVKALDEFASLIGLAYQIQDDILDIEASTKVLGKKQGSDAKSHKNTYPMIIGLQDSKTKVTCLFNQALEKLDVLAEKAIYLRALARYLVKREY